MTPQDLQTHGIRMIKCLDKFKKAIKMFLFNEAFCNH